MKRFKNIFTTFLGTSLTGISLYFVYNGKTTMAEASGFITIGIALIFSDDQHFAKNFLPFIFKNKNNNNEPEIKDENKNEGSV